MTAIPRAANRLPLAVLVLGLAISAGAALMTKARIDGEAQARFQRNVDHLRQDIQGRIEHVVDGLKGARAAFAAHPQMRRADFSAFADSRRLALEFPGVRGFAFAQQVAPADLAAFEATQRADGDPGFRAHGYDGGAAAGPYIVRFVEPVSSSASTLGLDVAAEPRRREAIDQALRSGEAALSASVALVQDAPRGRGFMLFLPVYRPGAAPGRLLGLLLAPLRTAELLRGLPDGDASELQFQLLDGRGSPPGAAPVFDSAAAAGNLRDATSLASTSRFEAVIDLPLPGRTLSLRARSRPGFEASIDRLSPLLVAGAGALASALLAALLRQQGNGRQRAEALARQMTADIERLALVARNTSNAVVITDPAGLITWVNAGFERISGYSAAEAMGCNPVRLLQCEGTDGPTVARLRAALAAGQGFSGELLNRGKTGRLHWLALEIQPLRRADGGLSGFMAIESDITERKQAEASLRASEAFLDKTGRVAGVGGWAIDLPTHALACTDQTWHILELPACEGMSLQHFKRFFTEASLRVIEQAAAEGLAGGPVWDVELQAITGRGRAIWVHLVAEAEFVHGQAVRIVGALQDISKRRAMADEMQRNARLLRGAMDALDEAFVLYDPDDRLVFCNQRYRDIYAISAGLMVPGARFEDILRHGAERGQYPAAQGRGAASVDEWVAERLASHRAASGPLTQQLADGRVLRIVERRLLDGHTVGFRIDITDLVCAKDSAERAHQRQSEFIATISHELRTPLQAITGFSDLGMRFAQDQPRFHAMFTDIHAGGMRMLRLVNSLLDISKIDGSAGSLPLRRGDVARLAADVAGELCTLAASRQLRIMLPDPLPRLEAEVDAFRIMQVLRNVLANAIRFAPMGSAIEVDGHDRGAAGIEIQVRDHGPGIPEAELESVFDAFVQSSRTRDGSGGTGLGLTISRKIIAAHGGAIVAANAAGGGAVFRLQLPVPAGPGNRADQPAAAVEAAAPLAQLA